MGGADSPTKGGGGANLAASTGGRGSMGGGISASAVDTDKLWRDRIRQELQFQRQWREEYGFMSAEGKSPMMLNASAAAAPPPPTDASSPSSAAAANSPSNKNNNNSPPHTSRSEELVATLLNSNSRVGSACATVDVSEINPKDLKELQNTLQKAQYTSTVQASYKFDRSKLLELGAGGHRKLKFRV